MMNHIKMPHLLKYRTVETDNTPGKNTGLSSIIHFGYSCSRKAIIFVRET